MNRKQMDESKRLCNGKLPVVALSVEDINNLPIGTILWDSVDHRQVVSGEDRMHPEETDGVTRYGLLLEVLEVSEGSPGYHPQQAQMEGRESTREETAAVLKDYLDTLIEGASEMLNEIDVDKLLEEVNAKIEEDEADTQVSDGPAADVGEAMAYLLGLTDVCPGCGQIHRDMPGATSDPEMN